MIGSGSVETMPLPVNVTSLETWTVNAGQLIFTEKYENQGIKILLSELDSPVDQPFNISYVKGLPAHDIKMAVMKSGTQVK